MVPEWRRLAGCRHGVKVKLWTKQVLQKYGSLCFHLIHTHKNIMLGYESQHSIKLSLKNEQKQVITDGWGPPKQSQKSEYLWASTLYNTIIIYSHFTCMLEKRISEKGKGGMQKQNKTKQELSDLPLNLSCCTYGNSQRVYVSAYPALHSFQPLASGKGFESLFLSTATDLWIHTQLLPILPTYDTCLLVTTSKITGFVSIGVR